MALVWTVCSATAVSKSFVCNFTSETECDLVLCKYTHIEIYRIQANGLALLHDLPINGRVSLLEAFRGRSRSRDCLLLTTEKQSIAILYYNPEDRSVETVSSGDMRNIFGKFSERGQLGGIDPTAQYIAVHCLQGIIKIIPVSKDSTLAWSASFNAKIAELNVISMSFVLGRSLPNIAIVWQDHQGNRHLKTYEVDVRRQDLFSAECVLPNCDRSTSLCLTMPQAFGGVLLVGESIIAYKPFSSANATGMQLKIQRNFFCATRLSLSGDRWLLGDRDGFLHLLVLVTDPSNAIVSMNIECLGQTTVSESIAYLDRGIVYISSSSGDSCLLQLQKQRGEDGNMFSVLVTFESHAPIVDFATADTDGLSDMSLIACCGSNRQGSIRLIHKGISISFEASALLKDIRAKGIWSLSIDSKANDLIFVITTPTCTRFFSFSPRNPLVLTQLPPNAFSSDEETLYAGNLDWDCYLQVTTTRVKTLALFAGKIIVKREWTNSSEITLAAVSDGNLAIVNGLGFSVSIFMCSRDQGIVALVDNQTFDQQVAAVSFAGVENEFVAIAFFNEHTVSLYDRSLKIIKLQFLLPSLLFYSVASIAYLSLTADRHCLIVGSINGQIFEYRFDGNFLCIGNRSFSVGDKPVKILSVRSFNQTKSIVVCAERSLLITPSTNSDINFSSFNLHNLLHIAPIMTDSRLMYAILSSTHLSIGYFEAEKLHTTVISQKPVVQRIAFDSSTETFAVCSLDAQQDFSSGYLTLFNAKTLQELCRIQLNSNEQGSSLEVMKISGSVYYVLGTGILIESEQECSRGFVRLFEVNGSHSLHEMFCLQVDGSVSSIRQLSENYLVAAYRGCIGILCLSAQSLGVVQLFHEICTHRTFLGPMQVRVHNDIIAVGDLLRSVSLYRFDPASKSLQEVARDHSLNTIIAMEVFDEGGYLCADEWHNLFLLRRNTDPNSTELDRRILETRGFYHLGDSINVFRKVPASFITPKSSISIDKAVSFATVSGAIGLIIPLSEKQFKVMQLIEQNLLRLASNIGDLQHESFRSFLNERRSAPRSYFIDGSLIELALSMSIETLSLVMRGTNQFMEESEVRQFFTDLKVLS